MATVPESCEILDPRIRRTRELLQHGLQKLLKDRDFDDISVQDIADAATVNRATFYDHYADKFALLECMVGSKFHELLAERNVQFDCSGALKSLALAVCDYLVQMQGKGARRQIQPHMESAVIAVLRRMLLTGLHKHPPQGSASSEIVAATASWAIYGAAKEWAQTPHRGPSEAIADTIAKLVSPVMQASQHLQ
jgi:AcrR family transcriptional regulator